MAEHRDVPIIEIKGELPKDGREAYDALIVAGAETLAPNEWWVIDHDEGPLWDTKSKQLDEPVRVFCNAVNCDWDQATDQGFRLARLTEEPANGGA